MNNNNNDTNYFHSILQQSKHIHLMEYMLTIERKEM